MIYDLPGRHLGTFEFHGSKLQGELELAGENSQLNLFANGRPDRSDVPAVICGELNDFTQVTCIDCVGPSGATRTMGPERRTNYSWKVFPHLTLVGTRHFDPAINRVHRVWFSVSNLPQIFDDADAYGLIFEPQVPPAELIPKTIGERIVPHGPDAMLAYFAGRQTLLDLTVDAVQIKVQHWPTHEMGTSEGVRLQSKLMIGIQFALPVQLQDSLNSISRLTQFLSLVAGRSQGVSDLQIYDDACGERDMPLLLHWSFAPKASNSGELDPPWSGDMPLDAITRPKEFERVLASWWETLPAAGLARARLHACRGKADRFDTDRLVAAANMFDLRPVAVTSELASDLARVRDESVSALKALPRSDDRDSAIQALKRLGAPSLRKKVLARARLVSGPFHFENLDEVLRIAVWSRNHFVHGGGDKSFDYMAVEPFTSFLTETLEFVFAAAELIECGWDGLNWRKQPHTSAHWFARYKSRYTVDMRALLSACGRA